MPRVLLLIAAVAAACGDQVADERNPPSIPLIAQNSPSPAVTVAERQRAFVSAMVDPDQDPSSFLYRNVTVYDHAHARPDAEGMLRLAPPSDYLRLLSARLPSHQMNATTFEILKLGENAYSVLSFPDTGQALQVTWLNQGGEWKVWSIRLNLPPEVVQAYREVGRRVASR